MCWGDSEAGSHGAWPGAAAMRRWRLAGAGPLKKAPAVLGVTMVLKAKIGVNSYKLTFMVTWTQ